MKVHACWIPLLALTAACSTPPASQSAQPAAAAPGGSPYHAVASVDEVMDAILDPAADVIWGSVGTIITVEGVQEIEPKTDEDWTKVRHAAITVSESGNLLMMEGRAPDDGDWVKVSKALVEVGTRAIKAADAKDKQALFDAGG